MDKAPLFAMLAVAALVAVAAGEAQGVTSHPFVLEWGESGFIQQGSFTNPQSVAIDSQGDAYVTDLGNMRVQKFNGTGTFILQWGGQGSDAGQFSAAAGIAVGDNSTIYVVDGQLNRVQHFDDDGSFIREWGQRGSEPGMFLLPNGITTDSKGNVYVVDTGNQRVQRFTPTGEYIDSIESHDGDRMVSPAGIAIAPDGTIFVSDPSSHSIKKFGPGGTFAETLDSSVGGIRMAPQGMHAAPDGTIYVADGENNRVLLLDSQGTTITIIGTMGIGKGQFKVPNDVALGPDGMLYVVDSGGHRVQKFATPHTTQPGEEQPVRETVAQPLTPAQDLQPVRTVTGDLTKPVILPPNDLVIEATGLLTRLDVGRAVATDESGIRSLEHNAANEFTIGTNTVIWTAIDGAGNMAIATQTVTVTDSIPPSISGITDVSVEATNPAQNAVELGTPVVTDTVGVVSVENDAPEFYPIGRTTVTWTAIDIAGNSATAEQLVTVTDTQRPVITVPDDVTAEAASPDGTQVDIGEAAALDNDVVTSVTSDAPVLFGLGDTTVTWAASDASGNVATGTQTVSILDTTPPQITPLADVTFEAESASTNMVDLVEPDVSDIQNVTIQNNAPGVFPLGQTVVTWTITDGSDNSATAKQLVTVTDTIPPIIDAPSDVTTEADSLERNHIELVQPETSDATGVESITSDAPELFPLGETIVTWTITDSHGNTATAEQLVMVTDTIPPTIDAPVDITAEANGSEGSIVELGLPLVDDLVAIQSVMNDAPESFPVGVTTVTWSATDTSENTASDLQIVTIIDTTPPVIDVPANVTAEAAGAGGLSIQIGEATASDELGISEITNDAPELFPLGETIVTWTVTDLHGNTATAEQLVMVTDTVPPTIDAPADVTAEADGPEGGAVDIGTAQTDDSIGVASIENDAPGTFALGETVVTWTVTDEAGNAAEAIQTVTVVDTIPPVVSAPQDVTLEATSALNNTAQLIGASATDAVGVISISNDAPERFPVGQTVVTWTASDAAGNSADDAQIISIVDTVAPVLHAGPPVTAEATGQTGNVVGLDGAVASDAVGVTSIENDAPDAFELGETIVTWTAADAAGNLATAIQTVTIIDTIPPVISAPSDVLVEASSIDDNVVNLGSPEADDAVMLQSITSDAPESFPLGETIVTWTAFDLSGNTANATQTVSIVDTTPPVIEVSDDVTLEASSADANELSLEVPVVTDAAGQVDLTSDAPSTFALGETAVTWTATDAAGNLATAIQTVTIIDTTPPVISVPSDVTVDATSLHTAVDIGEATGVDLIDADTPVSANSTETFELGHSIVEWRTSDSAGNEAISTQTVEVQACGRPVEDYNLVMGSEEDDIMEGTSRPDLIFALDGDDIVYGGAGDDCIFGGEGDDIIFGGRGDDGLTGNDGNDIIRGQSGMDVLTGMSGLDVLDGGDDSDSCNAAGGNDGDLTVKCESHPR